MPEADSRRWFALALICLASLMIVLDATIVNVALPSIQQDLGFSQSALAWVVNAYLLTFGGFMLLTGRLADLLGRRRMLVTGIALFTCASLVCGLAGSQAMLVVARGIQGIGGSIVNAVSLSMLVALFPKDSDRAKAMSVWGFVASGGGTVGVIAGGVLTQSLSWHWIFLINVPIGVAALALSRPLLPAIPGIGLRTGVDAWGAVAVVAAPVLAVYGVVNAGQAGWGSPVTVACILGAGVVAAAFVAWERRVRVPLVPLRVFRSRPVVVTNLITIASGAAFFGWFFFSPLYVQRVLGLDSLQTGLSFLPAMLTMGAMSLGISAAIVARFGPKRPLLAGLVLSIVGLAWFARAPLDGQVATDVLPPMLLLGLGSAIFFMPLLLLATADVDPAESGLISGLLSTSQMIGGAVGLAVLATVALLRTASLQAAGVPDLPALNSGYHLAFAAAALLDVLVAAFALTQLHAPAAAAAPQQAAAA